MIGKLFNSLKPIDKINTYFYKCLCIKCNTICIRQKRQLLKNKAFCNTYSCYSKIQINDIYGYLQIMSYNKKQNNKHYWNCLCLRCNKQCIKATSNILSGKTKSCGCLQLTHAQKDIKDGCINHLITQYRETAKRKKVPLLFTLNRNQFIELTSANCYYCGSVPNNKMKNHKGTVGYTYNGIDRINNSKGYVFENCVTCCETCNRMKLALSQADFYNHITKIYRKINVIRPD